MSSPVNQFYEFGPFRIDVSNRLLLRDGEPLSLTPKAVDTLLALVERGGEVLRKDELLRLVWSDCAVEEGNLTQNIYLLRKALGAGLNGRGYIETVPRRGYRFVGEVRETRAEDARPATHGRAEALRTAEGPKTDGEAPAGDEGTLEGDEETPHARRQAAPSPARTSRRLGAYTLPLACALAVLAGLFYLAFSGGARPPEARPAIQSVAVLPFKPLGPAGDDEGLGVGMADALITQLSNVRQIVVRPTSAVLKYEGSTEELTAIGRELNVDALLDGKFQRADGRLRVTVQLVSARDGTPLWADKFDEQTADVLAVQDTVARRVTEALALKLTSEEQRLLTKRFTENPDAYQAYLKGRYYWNRRETPALKEAIKYFEQALAYDRDYAPAYAGLAGAYATLGSHFDTEGEGDADAFPRAKAAALKALQLNGLLAEAHAALGVVKSRYDWDFEGAESEFRRAVELNPNSAHAHQVYALHLAAVGRADEAQAEMMRAQELNPLSFSIGRGLGAILFRARKYEQALEQFRRTLKTFPDDPMAPNLHRAMGWAYEYSGADDEALAEFIEAQRLENFRPEWLGALRRAYGEAGMNGYWREWLELRREDVERGRLNPFYLAQVYAFLGEKDRAFAYLKKACEDRTVPLPALRSDPQFDGLRADPRYQTLLQRIGLTPTGRS